MKMSLASFFVLLIPLLLSCSSGPMASVERSAIYHPNRCEQYAFTDPADAAREVVFHSADGTQLHGVYYAAPKPGPRTVLLFLHGNAGDLVGRLPVAKKLQRDCNASVLVFDYRGFGRSEGTPNEKGLIADARAAKKWLAAKEGVQPGDIVLMGRSLGGGVAVGLASEDGAKALVLQSTFARISNVGSKMFWGLPVRWMMNDKFDSVDKIANYGGPLLHSHGDADTLIDYSEGEELFAAAKGPKEFFRCVGGGHNTPQPPAYYSKLAGFLATHGRVR